VANKEQGIRAGVAGNQQVHRAAAACSTLAVRMPRGVTHLATSLLTLTLLHAKHPLPYREHVSSRLRGLRVSRLCGRCKRRRHSYTSR